MKKCFGMVAAITLTILLLMNPGSTTALADYDYTEDPDAIEKTADSVFMLKIFSEDNRQIAIGSAFLAFDNNMLVTNYHVVEDAAYITAVSDDQNSYTVSSVCKYDPVLDIALLQIDGISAITPLSFDTEETLKRSMKVVAIGSPAGLMNTISIGNISGFYHTDSKNWIQFTAPISSGSSGGPLLNDKGLVIGVTTATYASAQNVNMAVRASDVVKLYKQWDKKTKAVSLKNNKTYTQINLTTGNQTENACVYVTSSGTKYHQNPNCSKMRNPIKIDLLEAIEKGYEPCSKCYR